MSITSSYTHKVSGGVEQYAFRSALNPKQTHFVDRCDSEPWMLGIVQLEESLSFEDVQTLQRELAELHTFMAALNRRDLRRSTEPGQPANEELQGVGL